MDPRTRKLSAHLDLATLCFSETAEAQGIDNIPQDPEIIANLSALAEAILEPILGPMNLPISVTSGYRCPELNALVGGRPDSQHLTGEAADFLVGGVMCDMIAGWIAENLPFDELILEKFDPGKGEYGWIHCSYSRRLNRRIVSSFDGETYHPGLRFVGVRDDRLSPRIALRPRLNALPKT